MTKKEKAFLKALDEYEGIAETCNLEYHLEWIPRVIAAVGRSLARKGVIEITQGAGCTMDGREGSGSVYERKARSQGGGAACEVSGGSRSASSRS